MERFGIFSLAGLLALSACTSPARQQANIEAGGAGIIASYAAGNEVTLLYQNSTTTSSELQAEANRVCAKSGKTARNPRNADATQAKRIPGVDSKIIFQCS